MSFNGGDSYIVSGSTSGDIILHSITTNLSSKAFGHGPNEVSLFLFIKVWPYSYAICHPCCYVKLVKKKKWRNQANDCILIALYFLDDFSIIVISVSFVK